MVPILTCGFVRCHAAMLRERGASEAGAKTRRSNVDCILKNVSFRSFVFKKVIEKLRNLLTHREKDDGTGARDPPWCGEEITGRGELSNAALAVKPWNQLEAYSRGNRFS